MFQLFDFPASFTSPIEIGCEPESLLWLLPLVLSIAIVYKATKLKEVSLYKYTREVVLLFGSIMGFMILAAVVLYLLQLVLL